MTFDDTKLFLQRSQIHCLINLLIFWCFKLKCLTTKLLNIVNKNKGSYYLSKLQLHVPYMKNVKIYFRLFEIIQMVVSVIYVFKIVWLSSCLPKPGDREWSEDGLGYVRPGVSKSRWTWGPRDTNFNVRRPHGNSSKSILVRASYV